MADHDAALSSADYWDQYYGANTSIDVGDAGGAPTHEWFRSFDDIQEFLGRNLINAIGRTPSDNPWVVHIGSGDSVSAYSLSVSPSKGLLTFRKGGTSRTCFAWIQTPDMPRLFFDSGAEDDGASRLVSRYRMEADGRSRYGWYRHSKRQRLLRQRHL